MLSEVTEEKPLDGMNVDVEVETTRMNLEAELETTRRHLEAVSVAATACVVELESARLSGRERLLVRSLQEALVTAQRHLKASGQCSSDEAFGISPHKHQLMLLRAKLKCAPSPSAMSEARVTLPFLPSIGTQREDRVRKLRNHGRNAFSVPTSPGQSPPSSPRCLEARRSQQQNAALCSPSVSASSANPNKNAVPRRMHPNSASPSRIPVLARRAGSLPPSARADVLHIPSPREPLPSESQRSDGITLPSSGKFAGVPERVFTEARCGPQPALEAGSERTVSMSEAESQVKAGGPGERVIDTCERTDTVLTGSAILTCPGPMSARLPVSLEPEMVHRPTSAATSSHRDWR
jgi:hypothetical protein